MKPIIETRDLTIRFGSLIANDRLNISIEPGKIHAIAGEKRCWQEHAYEDALRSLYTNLWKNPD